MKVITAPERLPISNMSLFIAGGITGCENWQEKLIAQLGDLDITILNPRRPFSPSSMREQIEWEWMALQHASAVSFWFSHETVQPITLFELGKCVVWNDRLFVGVDDRYQRKMDVLIQLELEIPSVLVVNSIEKLAKQIKGWVNGSIV